MSRARDLADGTFDTLKVFDSALTDSLSLSVDTSSSYAGTVTQDDTGLTFNNNTSIRGYTFKNNTSNTIISLDSDGLKFNGDTAAANALDDYEEGTFSPSINVGTRTFLYATYTKIGDMVTVWITNLSLSDYTSSTDIQIGNLPFTSKTGSTNVGSIMTEDRDDNTALTPFLTQNANYIRLYVNSNTSGFTALPFSIFKNSSNGIYITLTYKAA